MTAARSHLHERPAPADEQPESMSPEGEPAAYSPTSPGGSASSSQLNDDLMSGIVDDPDNDLRDILMLYDVEERRAKRQQQKQIIDLVASLGGDARAYRRERARESRAIVAEFYSPRESQLWPKTCPVLASCPALPLIVLYPTRMARLGTSLDPA